MQTLVQPVNACTYQPVKLKHKGRHPNPRWFCTRCGRDSRLITRTYCCEWCGRAMFPAGAQTHDVKHVWIDWLKSYRWTHFATCTFPFLLDSTVTKNHGHVANYARRYMGKLQVIEADLAYFAVAEPDLNNQLHLHFLINAPRLTTHEIESAWTAKYHGITRVGAYHLGASVYSAKTLGATDLHSIGGEWKPC
jgi:hypothetical protein